MKICSHEISQNEFIKHIGALLDESLTRQQDIAHVPLSYPIVVGLCPRSGNMQTNSWKVYFA